MLWKVVRIDFTERCACFSVAKRTISHQVRDMSLLIMKVTKGSPVLIARAILIMLVIQRKKFLI